MAELFERGVVVVSIDTEQIWGYFDCLTVAQFEARYPNAPAAHAKLLARVSAAGVSATWFVVGGLAQRPGVLAADRSLWHCYSFLERLRDSCPIQEIGLHGGLTHLIWTDARATREIVQSELQKGIDVLAPLFGPPRSFSYPRNAEAYYDLLPQHGFQCFRGGPSTLAWRLGRSVPGAILRAWEELRRVAPPPVWPLKVLPGLWSIPASLFLYPIGPARARLVGLRSRVERFRRGLEAAARHRAIFHFCFHPENLAESARGFAVLDEILEELVQARGRGDIQIMTMKDVVARIERKQQSYGLQEQH
jgi:peptidoglycan/xylan/chitin deacetylase (PgdA/CDA1 family)